MVEAFSPENMWRSRRMSSLTEKEVAYETQNCKLCFGLCGAAGFDGGVDPGVTRASFPSQRRGDGVLPAGDRHGISRTGCVLRDHGRAERLCRKVADSPLCGGAGRDDGAEPKRHGKRADGADGKSFGQGNGFEENKEQRRENEQAQRGGDVNAADIQNAA